MFELQTPNHLQRKSRSFRSHHPIAFCRLAALLQLLQHQAPPKALRSLLISAPSIACVALISLRICLVRDGVRCLACRKVKSKTMFSKSQLKNKGQAKCKSCTDGITISSGLADAAAELVRHYTLLLNALLLGNSNIFACRNVKLCTLTKMKH